MTKKARPSKRTARAEGQVGPRQSCPCGSGRRYKACHGGSDTSMPHVVRSFESVPGECDWVAMREFVPAARAPVTLRPDAYDGDAKGRSVSAVTLLPGLTPALVRDNSEIWLAAQVTHQSGDPSRDCAEALRLALAATPGESVVMGSLPGPGLRLQDVIEPDSDFVVEVLDGFDFWFDGVDDVDGRLGATLESLNSSIDPTTRLESVHSAYWTSVGTKEHLRWVQPHDEEAMLTALARLHSAGADDLGPDSRLVGSFRAHGLLVPVWDLPVGLGPDALEVPAQTSAERLGDALAVSRALSDDERAARNGLANRQITIR